MSDTVESLIRSCYTEPFFEADDMFTGPDPRHVFVFGSNLQGIHGLGSARTAKTRLGAIQGAGEGFTGHCYAIPTKRTPYEVLSLPEIASYVDRFKLVASKRDHLFYVTAIGTGLAGYRDEEIAPMFSGAVCCYFPLRWRKWIDHS